MSLLIVYALRTACIQARKLSAEEFIDWWIHGWDNGARYEIVSIAWPRFYDMLESMYTDKLIAEIQRRLAAYPMAECEGE